MPANARAGSPGTHARSGRAPEDPASLPTGYGEYLSLRELRSSHRPRTREHAEGRFIGLHHAAEVLFSREIAELELAIASLRAGTPDTGTALACLRRSRRLTEQLTSLLALLADLISPAEFASFRAELGDASGAQSMQFWEIEVLSGHRATARGRLRALRAGGEGERALEKRIAAPSLWEAFLAAANCRRDDPEGLLRVLCGGGPLAELAGALRMHDLEWARWRAEHAIMAEAMIGASASGTGGTSGSRYLWSRVGIRFYPQLHEAVSLIHRHQGQLHEHL